MFGLSKKTYYTQDHDVDLTKRLEITKKIDIGGKQGIVIATRHTATFAPKNKPYLDQKVERQMVVDWWLSFWFCDRFGAVPALRLDIGSTPFTI